MGVDAAYLIGPFAKEAINAAHEASTDPAKYKLWFPEQLDPGITHQPLADVERMSHWCVHADDPNFHEIAAVRTVSRRQC